MKSARKESSSLIFFFNAGDDVSWNDLSTFFHQGQLKFVKIQNICLLSLVLTKCICARTPNRPELHYTGGAFCVVRFGVPAQCSQGAIAQTQCTHSLIVKFR